MNRRRWDPELGWVKPCSGCGEDWPIDAEFYWMQRKPRKNGYALQPTSLCRACWLERYRGATA